MKPCAYRKEHEWEWDGTRQLWMCQHCYATCDKPDTTLRTPIIDVTPLDSEKPTPPEPFPALGKDVHILSLDTIRKYGLEGRMRIYRDGKGRFIFERVK